MYETHIQIHYRRRKQELCIHINITNDVSGKRKKNEGIGTGLTLKVEMIIWLFLCL